MALLVCSFGVTLWTEDFSFSGKCFMEIKVHESKSTCFPWELRILLLIFYLVEEVDTTTSSEIIEKILANDLAKSGF